MVRAGKTGKGFTPQPSQRDILDVAAEEELLPQIARKILESRAAILIQRAWRSRNQRLQEPQQKETERSVSKLLSSFSQESFYQSKSQCLEYASKQEIPKLIKNLTARVLDARPQDPRAYLVQTLEALKAGKEEALQNGRSGSCSSCNEEEQQKSSFACPKQLETQTMAGDIGSSKVRELGIFKEDDLQVLFSYCSRTQNAGVAKALQALTSQNSSSSESLACAILEEAKVAFDAQKPSLQTFMEATARPIENCFSIASL